MTTKPGGLTYPDYSYNLLTGTGLRTTDTPGNFTVLNCWKYGAGTILPVNATVSGIAPNSFTINSQIADPAFAAKGGTIFLKPGAGSLGQTSGNVEIKDSAGNGGAWNTAHLVLGIYHLWFDSLGRLRVKTSAPTSDTDGGLIGTQT